MTDSRRGRQRPRLTATVTDVEVLRQRAYLVGVVTKDTDPVAAEAALDELGLLTSTAGSDPIESVLVRRDKPNPATFIGSGKVDELTASTKALDIDVVVFDNELSPAQQRNLQKAFECDVVDRVAVILDIFAQHASSREGMIQVELAQHRYRLPRLRGKGTEMSRLGAGINTRGPGETKLETDRRRILERVRKLEADLVDLARGRDTRSKARRRAGLPLVALVGYTNAGKSTLFNQLTGAGVLVEDQLFATLDSTVRKVQMPAGHEILVSDTVGFVRQLPHQLVEAFRSTLEQVTEADVMLHVVDAADPDPDQQIRAVRSVLTEIGAAELPELIVVNKIDAADQAAVRRLLEVYPGSVPVSALTGEGRGALEEAILEALSDGTVDMELMVPYGSGDVLATLHRLGEVTKTRHDDRGTFVQARVPQHSAHRFAGFSVAD